MKKLLIPAGALLLSNLVFGQASTTENYVQTKTYLDYNGTTPTKTSETVQYFDGLGRPKQIVNVKASPLGRDVVTHIEYDQFGRQVKDYLPVPQGNTLNGAIIPNPLSNAAGTPYGPEKIYSEKILENSPLDRIQQQIQVGNDWSNKPVKFEYAANIGNDAYKFVPTTIWENGATKTTLTVSAYSSANQLYRNMVTDEDGNRTYEYKNGQGQTILVRKMISDTEYADTYYVYNEYNQLAFVLPPKAANQSLTDDLLNALCYQYRYDARGRLVEKKLPGKAWEYMVYDRQDRLIMNQDAVIGALKQWLFTKYDQFGRAAYTGIYTSSQVYSAAGRAAEQVLADAKGSNNVARSATVGFTNSGLGVYYDSGSTSYPGSVTKLLTVNYYDTYPTGSSAVTNVFAQPLLTDNPANAQTTKGMLTASYIKNIEDDRWTKNFIWYDTKGRNIGSRSNNYLGGYTVINNKLDFAGVVLQTNTYHRRLGSDPEKVIVEKFTYDSQNRLLTHTHQVGNNPVEYLTQNKYNEISQLESKKVGGTAAASPLQTVDYKYNIRGWMTKVNDPSNLQNKLFAYELRYNNPNSQFSGSARYNGNISQMSWITQNDAVLRNYSYEYDALNRLKEGRFWDAMNLERGEYHEQLTYDLNGNIKTLLRRGRQLPGYTAPEVMDNLEYHYENGELSNKLSYLKEIGTGNAISGYPLASGSTGSTITYDLNGNMTTQLDKGISSIQYNYLNLPGKITQNSKITDYIYRADGVKVRKVFGTETTDYLDGFQYTDSVLKFFPTAEGYFNVETGKYVYNYTDHLGNTRLSYAKSGAETEIIEESNYYPFGLKHEGYNVLTGNPAYKYKYTGKELQEMGMYDYGTRFYMPDIGRWGVHDPLSEITLQIYSYADNNPIFYNDPTGMIAQQPEMHLTIYKHKRTGEEVNINDGVNATVLVNGYDFAKAKTYAKYFDYNRASLNGNSNYEVNQGYIDFYYNTRYGNGFSFASLFDSGPDKRRMPTSDEDTMILLEMPDIGRRGPLKGALKAVEKNVVKSLVEEDAKLVKLAQEAFKGNKLLRREAEALVEQLGGGNMNPGIGSKILGKNIFEARSRGGARVYFRQGSDGIEILGYSNKHNQQKVINQIFKKNK